MLNRHLPNNKNEQNRCQTLRTERTDICLRNTDHHRIRRDFVRSNGLLGFETVTRWTEMKCIKVAIIEYC